MSGKRKKDRNFHRRVHRGHRGRESEKQSRT